MKNPNRSIRHPNPSKPFAIARFIDEPTISPTAIAKSVTAPAVTPRMTMKRRAAAIHIALFVDLGLDRRLGRSGAAELLLRQRPLLERVVARRDVALAADAAKLRRL